MRTGADQCAQCSEAPPKNYQSAMVLIMFYQFLKSKGRQRREGEGKALRACEMDSRISTSATLAVKSHLAEPWIDLFLFTSIVIDLCFMATPPSLAALLFFSLDL